MVNFKKILEDKIQRYLRIKIALRILEIIGSIGMIFAYFMEEEKDSTLVILCISGILIWIAFCEVEIAICKKLYKNCRILKGNEFKEEVEKNEQ